MAMLTAIPATHNTTSLKSPSPHFTAHSPGQHKFNSPSSDFSGKEIFYFILLTNLNILGNKLNFLMEEKAHNINIANLISQIFYTVLNALPKVSAKYRVHAEV
jgi:hypothetical protein